MKEETKTSKLYESLLEVIPPKEVDELEVAESSKRILRKLKTIACNDPEAKNKLLKMHKLTIQSARKIILDHQAKEAIANFKKIKNKK